MRGRERSAPYFTVLFAAALFAAEHASLAVWSMCDSAYVSRTVTSHATWACLVYESVILSTLLCSAELWPLTVTLSKRLDAAHHRWLRRISGIWKDKVTNEEVRARTPGVKEPTIKCKFILLQFYFTFIAELLCRQLYLEDLMLRCRIVMQS